jgi:hypothetical protein
MALQSSGAISFSQIAAHFGGSTPHSMSEYYTLLGMGVSGLPSSGAFSFSSFHGKSNQVTTSVWVSSGYNNSVTTINDITPVGYSNYGSWFAYGIGGIHVNGVYLGGWAQQSTMGQSVNPITINGTTYYRGSYWQTSLSPQDNYTYQYAVAVASTVVTWIDTSGYVNTTTTAQI